MTYHSKPYLSIALYNPKKCRKTDMTNTEHGHLYGSAATEDEIKTLKSTWGKKKHSIKIHCCCKTKTYELCLCIYKHTNLLLLDWKRISSTEALREPDSSSFRTSLQEETRPSQCHTARAGRGYPITGEECGKYVNPVTMFSHSLLPIAWLSLVLHPWCISTGDSANCPKEKERSVRLRNPTPLKQK